MKPLHDVGLAPGERLPASEVWLRHFRHNRERDWRIPWEGTPENPARAGLSGKARRRIGGSIAEFQRGESSEARHYLAKSECFSGRTGDPAFHATSVLFIREENEHAALLLRFMRSVGIPPRHTSLGDRVFRWLRGWSDLGWTSRVLMIAELIAQEYYPCLRAATSHPVLVRICDKVIADEEAHIRFQVERIVRVEAALGSVTLACRDLLQRLLMAGTALVVYAGHWRVISAGLGFREFCRRVQVRNRGAIADMRRWRSESTFGIAREAAA